MPGNRDHVLNLHGAPTLLTVTSLYMKAPAEWGGGGISALAAIGTGSKKKKPLVQGVVKVK